jgi:exodeoxyribonuclease III
LLNGKRFVLIATWNVNSIRTRLQHVVDWLDQNPVDVLCLQETKVIDADFPRSTLEALGYHLYIAGQKSYNGVALLSRQSMTNVRVGFAALLGAEVEAFDLQKRVITGEVGSIQILNLYVPNGGGGTEKYEYKLQWLGCLQRYLTALLAQSPQLCMCGDFNIAPDDRDIHNPDVATNQVMATDAERHALQTILKLGLTDAFRKFTEDAGHYSWWDYRAAAFRRNLGWRIDHHYLSPALYAQAQQCWIDVAPRKREQPSDHAPVIVEL